MNIRDYFGKSILFFDGGTGSVLQGLGLKPGEFPENWNIEHPDEIVKLHYNYYLAGSNIIKSNTFGAFETKFTGTEGKYSLEQIIDAAFKNAQKARKLIEEKDKESKEGQKPRFIALDVGSCGKLLKPLGDLEFEDAVTLFKKTFSIGLKNNPDLILIETINDIYEAKAAVLAAKECMENLPQEKRIPIAITTVYDEGAKSLTGSTPEIMVAVLEGLGVDALGLNCSLGPVQMKPIVKRLLEAASVPVIVNPNAGLPRSEGNKTVYDVEAEEFSELVAEFCKDGALFAGGCCGTNPLYIKKLVEKAGKLPAKKIEKKTRSVITSGTKIVEFGNVPVLIGERINPTGKKKFKEALRNNDIPYILNEGITQEEKGAQVLDVNVGLPEIDECKMMTDVVKELQSVTDLPLQIDTSDPVTMEKALRIYNGKALVNSVNGKEEIMKSVFPIVKKYGGLLVSLTIDEDGIPTTTEGRIKIAEKIYKRAAEYGIDKSDIIIDPLAMAVSSDDQAGIATLQTVKYIKEKYNGNTILGVSNVSFGLPLREHITSIFFTMAMQNGLSAAIMNPNSMEMMKAWTCFKTLSGKDSQCTGYIEFAQKYEQTMQTVQAQNASGANANATAANQTAQNSETADPLIKAITKGLNDAAAKETRRLLEPAPDGNTENQLSPMQIINEKIIPALDIAGKSFEEKRTYLPQLLMSAEAAKSAFTVIKEILDKADVKQEIKGAIVLATVKGDIHDIGKNIVKVLLENYSFKIIDLGKDVEPEKILEEVVKSKIKLVGLSALMTTTVPAMAETIKLLRKDAPWCKVCVGGAVLTKEYAQMIDADRYCKDAMETVKYAQEVFEN